MFIRVTNTQPRQRQEVALLENLRPAVLHCGSISHHERALNAQATSDPSRRLLPFETHHLAGDQIQFGPDRRSPTPCIAHQDRQVDYVPPTDHGERSRIVRRSCCRAGLVTVLLYGGVVRSGSTLIVLGEGADTRADHSRSATNTSHAFGMVFSWATKRRQAAAKVMRRSVQTIPEGSSFAHLFACQAMIKRFRVVRFSITFFAELALSTIRWHIDSRQVNLIGIERARFRTNFLHLDNADLAAVARQGIEVARGLVEHPDCRI